jgi:hypothetical protein
MRTHGTSRGLRRWAIAVGAIAIGLVALCSAGRAHAQSTPSAADRETARTLMDEGFNRRDKKDYKGALDRFQAADALMHVPTTQIEVAITQIAMGLLVEARDTLQNLLNSKPKPNEPQPFAEARGEAKGLSDDIAGRIPSLRVVVRGLPDGVEPSVLVDGVAVPAKALLVPRKLNPGPHEVIARSASRELREQTALRERESKELLLDFEGTGTTPVATKGSGIGTGRLLLYIGGGVAAAGLITGTVAGVLAITHKSAAENRCQDRMCPPPTFGDIDASRTAGNVSTAAFIVAGVGAGVAVTGLVLGLGSQEDKERPPHSAYVTPWIGPGSAGLRGSF